MHSHQPFIIHLDIHPQGFTFHSTETAPSKPKKTAKSTPKPPQPKIVNRLIKEIAISSEIPPIIPQQNTFLKDIPHPEEPPKPEIDFREEQEEIDCQVKRQIPILDSPADWFDLKSIHDTQVDQFAQFFTGKGFKTPELYQAYRNFMVEAFRNNPKRYLAFISCRRILRGDVSCLLKIYQFLVREGIINYGLSPDGNYNFQGSSLAQMTEVGKKPQSCLKKVPEKSQLDQTEAIDTDNLTVSGINKNFSRNYRVYCSKCQLICGITWYSLQLDEQGTFNLCYDCYNSMSKEETAGYTQTDITKKIQGGRDSRKSYWCLQDNIKLLDFMGNSQGKSWGQIFHQFEGKKTVQDILLQFMQFPITNFDPSQHAKDIKHQSIQYKHEQYIDILDNLFKASPYATKEEEKEPNGVHEKKEEKEEKEEEEAKQMTSFKTLNKLFLSKFNNKISQLKTIETIWQLTNLDFREQPLISRSHPSKVEPQSISEPSQNSDNQ